MGQSLSETDIQEIVIEVREAVRSLDWSGSYDRAELEQQKNTVKNPKPRAGMRKKKSKVEKCSNHA